MSLNSAPGPADPKTAPVKTADAAPVPPDEAFWEKYSPHFEFPLSTVAAVAVHVLAAVVLILLLRYAFDREDKSTVKITPVQVGPDANGDTGSPGELGGPGAEENVTPVPFESNPDPLPNVVLSDPQAVIKDFVPEVDAQDLEQYEQSEALERLRRMNEGIRKQLAGDGGGGTGKAGPGDGGGGGKGGTTAKRMLRWTLRFETRDGRDYLRQLDAVGAVLLVPQPPDWASARVVRDLVHPNPGQEENLANLAGKLLFTDDRPDSVRAVARALGLDFVPPYFTAFFPKHVEEELAQKERNFRRLREDQIFSTTFQIFVRGGKYEITVVDQKPIRGRR